jgi:hypothetical protein
MNRADHRFFLLLDHSALRTAWRANGLFAPACVSQGLRPFHEVSILHDQRAMDRCVIKDQSGSREVSSRTSASSLKKFYSHVHLIWPVIEWCRLLRSHAHAAMGTHNPLWHGSCRGCSSLSPSPSDWGAWLTALSCPGSGQFVGISIARRVGVDLGRSLHIDDLGSRRLDDRRPHYWLQ